MVSGLQSLCIDKHFMPLTLMCQIGPVTSHDHLAIASQAHSMSRRLHHDGETA